MPEPPPGVAIRSVANTVASCTHLGEASRVGNALRVCRCLVGLQIVFYLKAALEAVEDNDRIVL